MNRTEGTIDRLWNFYCRTLVRFPLIILLLMSFVSIGLTSCFFIFVRVRGFDQNDFFIPTGRSMKNAERISKLFGDDKNLRVHQQLKLYPALDVIIRRKVDKTSRFENETNMLKSEIIDEIRRLDSFIQSTRIVDKNLNVSLKFSDLCALIEKNCVIDGNYLLSDEFREKAFRLSPNTEGIHVDSESGANGIDSFIFGKNRRTIFVPAPVDEDYQDDEEEETQTEPQPKAQIEIFSYVPLFRLRYGLNVTTDRSNNLAQIWEREAFRVLNEKFQSDFVELAVSTSSAISDFVTERARNEGSSFALIFLFFLVLIVVFISLQGNKRTSVGFLPLATIINCIFSAGSTFGLLTLFTVKIIEPMALTIISVSIINCLRSSIICGIYHSVIKKTCSTSNENHFPIEKIFRKILKSCRSHFIVSTFISLLSYVVLGLLSPIPSISLLSFTFALLIFVDYFIFVTFFSSCLIINLKRFGANRHSFTYLSLPKDLYVELPQKSSSKNSFKKKFYSSKSINRILLKILSGLICLLSLTILIVSLKSISLIDTKLYDDRFLPRNATLLRSYMKSQTEDYSIGPIIMFTLPVQVSYQDENIKKQIIEVSKKCLNDSNTNTFRLVWLEKENLETILDGSLPEFLRITPYSRNDLAFSQKKEEVNVTASRFFCQYKTIIGDRGDLETMNNMYDLAEKSGLPSLFPYSLVFPHYEALSQIRFELIMLISIGSVILILFSIVLYLSLKKTLLIFGHFILIFTVPLAILQKFQGLTINFASSLWFYFIPMIYLDGLLIFGSNHRKSKWIYNRLALSLVLSLSVFFLISIETYVFEVICYSLIYQSVLFLLTVNLFLPSWFYLLSTNKKKNERGEIYSVVVQETNQPLPSNGKNVVE